MPSASASASPARPRDGSHDDRSERRNDGGRDKHRRRRASRSPHGDRDGRGKHHSSRRHRDDASAAPSDDEPSVRRRGRRRRSRSSSRSRSRSRSRSKHRHRSRSKDAARDRYEKKRRYEHHSTSPRRHHRPERRRDREESPRHSRRSRHDNHHRSRSRSPKRRKPPTSASPPRKRSNKPLPSQDAAFRGGGGEGSGEPGEPGEPVEKQKPNFKQSGLLAREANTVAGTDIVLKYNEPPDARKPPGRDGWRVYVFKGQDILQTVELGSRSCWLVGREAAVADLLVEHPSTSKQHAVLQFRHTTRVNEYGDKDARVRPYLIDLESSNGTMLNGKPIEASRYVEVMDKDMIKFGLSEREYVVMLPPA